jgi:hypothetical protein
MADIHSIISEAFKRRGLDPSVGLRIGAIESRLNPNARNPSSSAGGLFQFIDSTAANYGLTNKFDPVASSDAAARLTADNAKALRLALGRDATPGELYLAHQQGAGGATKLLQNPDTPAASLVGTKAVLLNGGNQGMTARDFAALWSKKMGDAPVATPGAPAAPAAPPPESPNTTPAADTAPQQPAGPDLGSILANAFTSMTQSQPQKQVPAQPASIPLPEIAPKRPDLAKILAGVSAPLLIGRQSG